MLSLVISIESGLFVLRSRSSFRCLRKVLPFKGSVDARNAVPSPVRCILSCGHPKIASLITTGECQFPIRGGILTG